MKGSDVARPIRNAGCGAVLAVALLAGEAASAQQSDTAPTDPDDPPRTESEALDTIVVTANRREQALIDVPMSIVALDQSDIDQRGIATIHELSRAVAGMVVSEQGPGQNRIFLRGVTNPNSLTSLVGVYLNEIPVTSASLGQLDLQLTDLERVEVLRGPQGTLYGQGSAGGTIRLITRKPELDALSGAANVSAYATEDGDPSQRINGTVNLPIVEDVLGLRLSGTYGNIGGWIDQPAAGREDINDQDLRHVRVEGLWAASGDLTLETTAIVHRNDGGGITTGTDADYNVSYPNGDPLARQDLVDDYEIFNITASYDFGDVNLLSSTSQVQAEKLSVGVSLKVPGLETFNSDSFDIESFSQELRLSASDDEGWSWVVGAFYNDSTVDRLLILNLYSGGVPLGVSPTPSIEESSSWSVFGDVSYALTDRLDVGAGVRYFDDEREAPPTAPGGIGMEGSFDSVDPRFYLSYDLSEEVKLYANVAKGFRSGGFTGDLTVAEFDPETVWSYELGAKAEQGRWRWQLTGYFSEYEDYQAFVLQGGVFGGLTNAGDAEILGVEWLLGVDATPNLSLQLSGNVADTELVSVEPGTTSNAEGDRLDFVPDYSVSVSAEYRFQWRASTPGFFRLDYNQTGPSTFTERSLGIVEEPTDTLRLLNARLGLQYDRWSAELFGQNLLSEDGVQDPLQAIGFGSRPRPRVLGVEVRFRF